MIQPILEIMNQNFQSALLSIRKHHCWWMPHTMERSFGNHAIHTPEGSQVRNKDFWICHSSTGYLWHFIVYNGAGTEVTPGIHMPDQLKSSKIMVKLSEPLMYKGHTLWIDNYYNSPSLCVLLRDNDVHVTGTVQPNRKHVPDFLSAGGLFLNRI
jgi:hypothetical protein